MRKVKQMHILCAAFLSVANVSPAMSEGIGDTPASEPVWTGALDETFADDGVKSGITLDAKGMSMTKVFKTLAKQTNYKFLYVDDDVKNITFTGRVKTKSINEAMRQILAGKGLKFTVRGMFVTITKADAAASSQAMRVSGRVVDDNGYPLLGATVRVHGTKEGVTTDGNGAYSVNAKYGDMLQVSYVGYNEETVLVQRKPHIDIILKPSSEMLDEVTVVAFGTQKKESVVSAITTVKPGDLKSSSSDLTTTFAGRIPGIIGWQTGGMPGALTEAEMNTKFYVRGITSFQSNANSDPLILLDGVECSKLDLARLAVEDIESFSVMKDASATAMYGARGANGVILVTTKKGEEGNVYTTMRYEMVMSQPTRQIEVVDPVTYMQQYNQALLARSETATPKYSVERINRTILSLQGDSRYPTWAYPANDWYDILFKDQSINHRAGVTIRGGSKVVQYYASVNYNRDEGMLKTDKLNDFNCNIVNNQFQYRTNLNIQLNTGIKLVINSTATLDKYNGPIPNQSTAYWYAFNASPADFAPTYPGDDTYGWPHIRFGTSMNHQVNPYAQIQRGYTQTTRYNTINKAEYIHNLSKVIKGLEVRLSASLVQTGYYSTPFQFNPYFYALSSYDDETGKHTLEPVLFSYDEIPRRTLRTGTQSHTTDTRVTYEGRVLHTAAWGDHQTSLTGVFQAYERTFTPVKDVLNGMAQRNLTYSMRGSYGYKDRYFAEASFGYNGSERFAPDNRMGFFPAGGLAWVVSSEPWMKRLQKVLPFFKLRLSYGKVGNDGVIDTPRYVYLPEIVKGAEYKHTLALPYTYGSGPYRRYAVKAYPNPDIQWEVAEQGNIGIEAKLFKGLVEVQADVYREIRHNIISNRVVIPANMGIEYAPLDNIGKTLSRGVDLSAKVQHAFNNDFWIILNGTLTYNKVTFKEIEEAIDKPEWQKKVGQEISQSVGYIAEGTFRDWEDIENSPVQGGDVMPGDIKYRDLNGDGVIDVKDATYIGYPETPRLIYGFSGFINLKNWEFSFAFQGSGKRTFFMNPSSMSPFDGDHAMLKAIYDSHWSEDNQAQFPFWPRLSTYNITKHNPQEDWYNENNAEIRKSTFFMRECSFLRCTSLELSYNLPRKLTHRWGLQNVKLTARANNPFCITNFKVWDVELGEDGFNYPIQKTYSVGLNVNF